MLNARVKRSKKRPTMLLINAFGTARRPGSLILEARKGALEIAEEMAQEARDALYRQRFKMAPLTPRYLAWKIRKGLDQRKLIAIKKMVRAIASVETPYGARIGIKRGFRIDTYVRADGTTVTRRLSYALLQRWLEYGTRTAPPRPLWRPLMRSWRNRRHSLGLRLKKRLGVKLHQLLAGK